MAALVLRCLVISTSHSRFKIREGQGLLPMKSLANMRFHEAYLLGTLVPLPPTLLPCVFFCVLPRYSLPR